ncbi:hypothetical protein EDB84DRAFT_1513366, partial [Lactarius hengduanensis]
PDGSQACKYESQIARTQIYHARFPNLTSARTFNTSATNRQSLAFDFSFSSLSPLTDAANTVGNDAAATLAQQRA